MRTIPLILSGCAILALAGCGKKSDRPTCVADELGSGVVSIHSSRNEYSCEAHSAAATMADYMGKRPELDVEVTAFARNGAVTTLRTTPKTKTPAIQ